MFQPGDQIISNKIFHPCMKSSVGTTHINNGFQPGDQIILNKTFLPYMKSSVGTTHINNGFQPGEKQKVQDQSISSVGTTHINNGFQPGDQIILNKTFLPYNKSSVGTTDTQLVLTYNFATAHSVTTTLNLKTLTTELQLVLKTSKL